MSAVKFDKTKCGPSAPLSHSKLRTEANTFAWEGLAHEMERSRRGGKDRAAYTDPFDIG